ncbi:Transcription factor RF2a [Apostasia shenzhenica]|uniref:Transcription factor RF2a n=1 Tax=Apostasia shenzhenica TaxID=1088818 RepID=A0A2I0AU89_9ASPA|nr:Transcription factor RF2a [Apostasia shenzhenica]
MSSTSHLPPRCPVQNKCLRTRSLDSSQILRGDDELLADLSSLSSQDSLLEEHTSWLDELLSESDGNPKGICHRRSSSDSFTIFQGHANLSNPIIPNILTNGGSFLESNEESAHGGLEANCLYGPNSPRQRSKLTNSESAIVNTLLENVPLNTMQYIEVLGCSNNCETVSEVDVNYSSTNPEMELEKTTRRRSGQRSRVRKLQYIADLQKTVDSLQTLGTDLAAKVASLFQQRMALSLENKTLKRQITILRHQKIIKDGEYQNLKNEAERLKMISAKHRRSKSIASCLESGQRENVPSGINWQSLDFEKLNLGGGSVSNNYGLRH